MSLTKRYIEDLIEQGKICPICFNTEHDYEQCIAEYAERNTYDM